MADAGAAKGRGWLIWLAVTVAAAGVVAFLLRPEKAKVEGATAQERIASICSLADSQPRGAAEAIARAAANDPDPAVRRAALLALERFLTAKYRPLVEAALSDADAGVRAAAATALGRFGDQAAADRLHELAVKDASPAVRLAAVAGLGENRSAKATVHLVQVMENCRDPKVQMRAREALARKYRLLPGYSVHPNNVVWWRNEVELIKERPEVIAAFRETNTLLKLNPGHVVPDMDGDEFPVPKLAQPKKQ